MKFVILAAVFMVAFAEPEIKIDGGNFQYSTGDAGGHKREESIYADGSVSGSYSYVDPNGDLRSVNYKAGPGIGFQASGDISVDKKTAEAAAELEKLAPKAPEPVELKAPVSPFTIPAPLYAPGILGAPGVLAAPGLLNAPLPIPYGYPLLPNALPYGLVGQRLIL